jgi:hypothetical protein
LHPPDASRAGSEPHTISGSGRGVMKRHLFALSIFLSALQPNVASAQICNESCYKWCNQNRPTDSCRSDCAGRPACVGGKPTNKQQCLKWCANNNRSPSCTADCETRKW